MASIYVHLPFCPYICPYCDFAKWPYRRSSAERYLSGLRAEIVSAPAILASTLYFGGGTPNTIAPDALVALIEALRERFGLPADAEITLEANPDPGLCEALPEYRRAGVNRLSIGVQSLDPAELVTLGRQHTPQDVETVVRRARAAGFENLSLDLMFAIPGQTLASWKRSVNSALALEPQHISTYGLTIEPSTPYEEWQKRQPEAFAGNDLEAEQYRYAIDRLVQAGFQHYEVSNFARPGFRCRHNQNYWLNGEYLGLGVGAASYLDGTRSVHTRDLEEYVRAALSGSPVPGSSEHLIGAAQVGEAAMLALRTDEGVDLSHFRERYGVDFLSSYQRSIRDLEGAGMLEITPTHVRLTATGRFVANDVCAEFIA